MMEIIQIVLLLIVLVGILLIYNKDKEPSGSSKGSRAVVLDTSAIIDGRILEVVKNGFLPARLVVAQFVLAELQMLADGRDAHKRERARFGLDVIKELQDSDKTDLVIDRSKFPEIPEVDDKLVKLAKKTGALLYTTDYNLKKVADIEGVIVLNVNELAQSLRPVVLPGETKDLKIIQRGSNKRQGVGYLEDGTMVVVDGAASKIGKTIKVTFSKTFQTAAGKMLFAELPKTGGTTKSSSRRKANKPRRN